MKSEYLVHHGVKGMKWGVRKEQPTSSSSRKKTSEKKYTEAEYKKLYTQARSRQFRIFLRAFAIGSALYGIRAIQRKAMADKIADEVNKRIEHLNDVKVDGGTVSNSSTGKTVYNASHDTINDYLSKHGAGHLKFNADGTIDIVE